MKRLLPSSLFAQVMVSVGLALLVAQIVSAVLLYQASEERREDGIIRSAAFQLIHGAQRAERREARRELRIARRGDEGSRRGPRREIYRERRQDEPRSFLRSLRYMVSNAPPFDPSIANNMNGHEKSCEEDFREILAEEGVTPHRSIVTIGQAGRDQFVLGIARDRPRFRHGEDDENWRKRRLFTFAIQREEGGNWETVRIIERERPRAALGALLFQTLVTFSFLLIILYLVLRRITRPLAQLTERVDTFSRQPDRAVLLDESGPSDMRRLIAAHNEMELRVAALLDEKDVMLGAIGHDLKTPLAALRVRVESVPDESQRTKMAASIEDITATLDDILSLARIGRDGSQSEPVDLCALASGISEEFEDMGEPVTLEEPPEDQARLVAHIQVTWIKRAVRNLVSNAVRYGGNARLSVLQDNGHAIFRIDDDGPGIPNDQIEQMLEPFTRGESSRNRATGGAGLGLTLARAIAEQHGGSLALANRENTGLRAEIRLPLER